MATLRNICQLAALLLVSSLVLTSCSSISPVFRAAGRNIAAIFSSPREVPDKLTAPHRSDARLAVTWIGHSTVLIQLDDKFVLTDPVLTTTVGQFSKRLVEPGIDPENIPVLDAVIISHLHFEHLSLGSLDMIEQRMMRLVVPEGGMVYVPNYRCDIEELSRWNTVEWDGLRITAVPIQHNGWRYGLDDAWMTTSYSGYVIEYNKLAVYFAGDTGYDSTMVAETQMRFPSIDLTVLPIAPIKPREYSGGRHTDPADALRMFRELKARFMVPIHYDTFPESYDVPGEAPEELRRQMELKGLTDEEVAILEIGGQRVFLYKRD